MLQRIAPTLFQGSPGETVTIAAVAQANNGVEAATFRYGAAPLASRQVQGHPGCEFNVVAGTNTFGAVVVFDPSSPNARYELFEEDDNGLLQPLQLIARPLSGPLVQFQIATFPLPVQAPAPVRGRAAKKAAKKVGKKPVKKAAKKAAQKAVKKAAQKPLKRAAKKPVKRAAKKTARKTAAKLTKKVTKRVTKKAARRGKR
jgi:hypothetical protein